MFAFVHVLGDAFDAHVHARAALVRRVVEHWFELGAPGVTSGRWSVIDAEVRAERMKLAAARALAAHVWSPGWELAPLYDFGRFVHFPGPELSALTVEAAAHYWADA